MKRTVVVTIEKQFVIDIPDVFLTDKYIADYEDFMGEIENKDKVKGMFENVAFCAANDYDDAEAIGGMGNEYMRSRQVKPDEFIVYSEDYEEYQYDVRDE